MIRSRVVAFAVFAATAGFVLGACGGTLYDPDHVPAKATTGGSTCNYPQIACVTGCVDPSPSECEACGVACPGAPQNGVATCGPPAPQAAWVCGFKCDTGFFKGGDGQSCKRATSVVAGGDHSCAILEDGSITCWGANDSGQLGPNAGAVASSQDPVRALSSGVTHAALGAAHTCAIQAGTVKCWGSNIDGQLGNGTQTGGSTPVTVTGLPASTPTRLAAGSNHTCALLASGALWCWGWNASGQLGTGSTTPNYQKSPVASLVTAGATDLAAKTETTCALVGTQVKCFGANGFGQVGNGSTTMQPTPDPALLPTTGTAVPTVLAVGGQHACAVQSPPQTEPNSGLYCWGDNSKTQLGSSSLASFSSRPIQASTVDNGQRAVLVLAGGAFTCSAKDALEFKCQGENDQGQAGAPASPTADGTLTFGGNILSAGAGLKHGCALVDLTPTGPATPVVKCWGANALGQLGRATTPAGSGDPTPFVVGP